MKSFEVTPKSPERLQAQVEAFADRVKDSSDQTVLLKYSAALAQVRDLNNLPNDLPDELVQSIRKHKDDYRRFLQKEQGLEMEFSEENVRIYKERFQEPVRELKERMIQGDPKKLPEYLGSGSNGSAYRIEIDGTSYAVKFNRSLAQANFEIKPLIRAKGLPHVAQLEGYSFEDGVVIMGLLPGEDVSTFTPEDAPEYSDEHIIQLIETVRALDARGITIDPKPSNFMYDRNQGFSVLDFHLKNERSTYGLPQELIDLRAALTARKFPDIEYRSPEEEGRAEYEKHTQAQSITRYKISLPMTIRLVTILKEKYLDIYTAWKKQNEADLADSNKYGAELVNRKYIPQHPDLEPSLKQLKEMGF